MLLIDVDGLLRLVLGAAEVYKNVFHNDGSMLATILLYTDHHGVPRGHNPSVLMQ